MDEAKEMQDQAEHEKERGEELDRVFGKERGVESGVGGAARKK